MGDTATAYAIRRAARTMSKAASVMRKGADPGGDTAELAAILRSCPTFDADDWEMLALLVEGNLCRADGNRSASYNQMMMRDAEKAVRDWRKKNPGTTLEAACEAILAADGKKESPHFPKLDKSTLFNYVRRSQKDK